MNAADEVDRVAALAAAVQRSAMLPLEEQAALLDTYRRARERVLRQGGEDAVRRLAEIDGTVGPRVLSRL
ncbi:hypothetical protein GCM10009830_35220 [Glycomyces endophyticus]|uniref:Uncharacterized protein n=1 Tax=Glycomyces endophyticus TaxID=480996 RepID=A0ABN2HB01_9ACTN